MLGIVVLIFLLFSNADLTCAEQRGDPATGLSYAKQVCATCHAIRQGDSISPNPLAPSFDAIANSAGASVISLGTVLRSVHENMPNFALSPNEEDNVTAYILSLKKEG